MITAEPDITRLLGRLKALKLVRQRRDRQDRRVVCTQISEAGLELLRAMDPDDGAAPGRTAGAHERCAIGRAEPAARAGAHARRKSQARRKSVVKENR